MDLPTFERLLNPCGQSALAVAAELAPTEANFIASLKRLEARFERELAWAALETALLRRRAATKFSRADVMYFEREALEQASGEVVARHRALRFADFGTVGDFCCGIGGDAVALAERGPVIAVDADLLRLAMARANVAACVPEANVEFRQGDLRSMELPTARAAFFDPDRRVEGRRRIAIRDYEPPPDEIRARLPAGFPLGMKAAPAVGWEELRGCDAEVEFISLGGELKECVLWFGPLATTRRRATVLPAGATLAADEPTASRVGPMREFLYDPDPAVTRAGLVADLGNQLEAHQVDADVAFLSSDHLIETPFARAYRIEAALPFNQKRLRELLRARNVGRVTIVKRGSAVDVETLRRQLKLAGDEHRVVILTRVAGTPYTLVGQ